MPRWRHRLLGLLLTGALGPSACGGGDPKPAAGTPPPLSPSPPSTSPSAPPRPEPAAGEVRSFHSRKDLRPAGFDVKRDAPGAAPGDLFVAPRPSGAALGGPMIMDAHGRLLWFGQLEAGLQAVDLKVQRYDGQRVLTWGQRPDAGHGGAENVIADSHYRVIATVKATEGVTTDLHDFTLLPSGRALVLGYREVPHDLSAYGGPSSGLVQEDVVQIVDVRSGRALWTWNSLDHIGLDESNQKPKEGEAFDYLHANSLAMTDDGDVLMSARHTSAVYKIDPRSDRIVWRLNGSKSDFAMGPGTRFAFQHDAQPQRDGTITVFDNAEIDAGSSRRSSGMRIALDHRRHRARLVRAYKRPNGLLSTSQGNYQVLPDGHAFVGWGSEPVMSEFSAQGRLLFDAALPSKGQQSYRAYRFPWTGHPTAPPDVVAGRGAHGRTNVFVSWNGATEVDRWQLMAGPTRQRLRPVTTRPWQGFETRLSARTPARWVAVRALGPGGRVLGRSPAVVPVAS